MAEVSVLIVNWNTRDLLYECLKSLRQAEDPGTLEVIVVDNGSSDGSVEMVREEFSDVLLLQNTSNLGFAAAVNQADEVATAPFRLMLNSDTVVTTGAISGCLGHLVDNPDVAVVGCRLLNSDGSHQSSVFRFPSIRGMLLNTLYLSQTFPRNRFFNWDRYGLGDWNSISVTDVVMGSFLLIRRGAVSVDKPLLDDGYFMYGEEADMCRRIVERGGRIEYHPGYEITHIHGASSKTPAQVAWSEEAKRRATLRFLLRWRSKPVAWSANFVFLLGLGPRWFVWTALDIIDKVRGREAAGRRLRAGVARFHFRAIWNLSVLEERWGAPPSGGGSKRDHRFADR